MAWQDEAVEMLRIALDDLETPYTYDDTRLEKLFLLACGYVQQEVQLENDYTISVANETLSPDPIEVGEYALLNLGVLKALCILYNSILRLASGKGIDLTDGGTKISFKNYYVEKAGTAKTACEHYNFFKDAYAFSHMVPGQAIITPFTHDKLTVRPS